MEILEKNWFNYARTFPVVDVAMRNLSHPVLGPTLRRLFRFEGPGRHTQSHIVPINQQIGYDNGSQNVIMPIERIRRVIEDSSYRILMLTVCGPMSRGEAILMEETVPMKDNLLDHFWGFRPKIRG